MLAATWKFVVAAALAGCASELIMLRVAAVFWETAWPRPPLALRSLPPASSILYVGLVIVLHRGVALRFINLRAW